MTEKNLTIEVAASANVRSENHRDLPPSSADSQEDDESSFAISTIRLSDEQDTASLEDDIPDSPKLPPPSPFRNRWVRGMHNPNSSFGSPNIRSPVTKFTPPRVEHVTPNRENNVENTDKKDMGEVLDASTVTSRLLESSFTGPDSTNARLEAAYMWTKRENNSLLKKIKDLEEEAAAREQEKLDQMMAGVNETSPLKWAKSMLGASSPGAESSEGSHEDKTTIESQSLPDLRDVKKLHSRLIPSELQSVDELVLPSLSPTTITSELRTNASSSFGGPDDIAGGASNETSSTSFKRLASIVLFALVYTIASVHWESVKTMAAPVIERHQDLVNNIANAASEHLEYADTKLQPVKAFIAPHAASVMKFGEEKLEKLSQVTVRELHKVQQVLGFRLDWESDILPMAYNYDGEHSELPLLGFNVVIVRASTEVGRELINAFSRLGAHVLAVDSSTKSLASAKGTFVDTMAVNFADLVAVSKAADDISESFSHIDVLINCVSSYSRDFGLTKQGYEKHFGGKQAIAMNKALLFL